MLEIDRNKKNNQKNLLMKIISKCTILHGSTKQIIERDMIFKNDEMYEIIYFRVYLWIVNL